MNYKNLLKSKKFKVAVWGTGYIGLSTMVYFAKKKVKCLPSLRLISRVLLSLNVMIETSYD